MRGAGAGLPLPGAAGEAGAHPVQGAGEGAVPRLLEGAVGMLQLQMCH